MSNFKYVENRQNQWQKIKKQDSKPYTAAFNPVAPKSASILYNDNIDIALLRLPYENK